MVVGLSLALPLGLHPLDVVLELPVALVGVPLVGGLYSLLMGLPLVVPTLATAVMAAVAWLLPDRRIAQAAQAAGFGHVRECKPSVADVSASIESWT